MAEPFSSTDFPGLLKSVATATTASAASPGATTYTMPRQGTWLIVVVARVNGSLDHSMTGVWLVMWSDQTNDVLLSTQLGATAKATGSSFSLGTLTLSNPTSAGVLTATATWGDGANHAVTWTITARHLAAT